MGTGTDNASRRSVLRRGLVLCAGAIGLGAGGASASAATGKRPLAPQAETLNLYGRNWHLALPGQRFGRQPAAGDRARVHGELLDRPGGQKVGEFHGAWLQSSSPFGDAAFSLGSIELHTFTLTGGSLFGIGTAAGDEGTFAVVGGTGRYAGMRGTYRAVQRPNGVGGDGSAEFTLNLSA